MLTAWQSAVLAVVSDLPALTVWLVLLGVCAARYPRNPLRYTALGGTVGAVMVMVVATRVLTPMAEQYLATNAWTLSPILTRPLPFGFVPATLLVALWNGFVAFFAFSAVAVAGAFTPPDAEEDA